MKRILNTLYVTTPDAYLSKDGTNIVVSVKGQEIFRIPAQNIEAICTFGYQGASPGVMKLCADKKIGLSFFTPQGRFIARVQGPVCGNVLLRTRQYSRFQLQDVSLHLSSIAVTGKIYNSRVLLRRFIRDYPDRNGAPYVEQCAEKLRRCYRLAQTADSIETLRGIEGEAASVYFSAFPNLILNNDRCFIFAGRNKRPPTDIVNAMLSFGYSLLAADCASALESVGLDPAVGFMHTLRPGRNSLALDLMEELRAYIVDRLVLSMINMRQVSSSDFLVHDDDCRISVEFTDKGRKAFLTAWQNKKKTEIVHPFLNEKISLGLLPYVQAMLLARYLRQDLDDYPVFIAK